MFGKPVAVAARVDGSTAKGRARRSSAAGQSRVRGVARGARPGAVRRASPRRSPRPGEGQIKALITVAGNPVISVPDSAPPRGGAARARLHDQRRQLPQRDRRASPHVILPGPSPLESPHFDELIWGWAVAQRRPTGATAIFPPPADRPTSGRSSPGSAGCCTGGHERGLRLRRRSTTAGSARCAACRASTPRRSSPLLRPRRPRAHDRPHDPHRPVGRPLRRGPRRAHARARSRREPHGIDLGPMVPARSTRWCARPSGKIELAPAYILGDLPRLRAALDASRDDGLVLVSRRHLRSKNSLDAQREGAGEGQGPLHAARAPRRRRGASASSTAAGPGHVGGRHASRCRSR